MDEEEAGPRSCEVPRRRERIEKPSSRGGEGVEKRIDARGVTVPEERQHGPGAGTGVGRSGMALEHRVDGGAVARVGQQIQVPREERSGQGRIHRGPTCRPIEGVPAGGEVPHELPRIGVATERDRQADAIRQSGLRERQGNGPEPHAHGDHRDGPRSDGRVRDETLERVADDPCVIRPEALRFQRRELGNGHCEAGAGEERRGPGEARVVFAFGGQSVDQDEAGPRAVVSAARAPEVRRGRVRDPAPHQGLDNGRRRRAREPRPLSLGQELDEEGRAQ